MIAGLPHAQQCNPDRRDHPEPTSIPRSCGHNQIPFTVDFFQVSSVSARLIPYTPLDAQWSAWLQAVFAAPRPRRDSSSRGASGMDLGAAPPPKGCEIQHARVIALPRNYRPHTGQSLGPAVAARYNSRNRRNWQRFVAAEAWGLRGACPRGLARRSHTASDWLCNRSSDSHVNRV